ncbi:MAG: hypothetical protein J6K20_00905 [Thermoguttaceae bacterium]|nr:hypothetical protein [Thermoguttaceae bacterium]
MRKTRCQRRGAATRVLLLGALVFGAADASPVVLHESPSTFVFAALANSESAVDRAVPERLKS